MAAGPSLISGNTSFLLSQVAFLMGSFVHLERPKILRNLEKHMGFCFVPFCVHASPFRRQPITAQLSWELAVRQDAGFFCILMSVACLPTLQLTYFSIRPAVPWVSLSMPDKTQVQK